MRDRLNDVVDIHDPFGRIREIMHGDVMAATFREKLESNARENVYDIFKLAMNMSFLFNNEFYPFINISMHS